MRRLRVMSTRLFKHCTHLVAIISIVLACASTLSAQDRLFALLAAPGSFDSARLIEIDTRSESFSQVRKTFRVPPLDGGIAPVSIGGGRFLVWLSINGADVHAFDTQTERTATWANVLPVASYIIAADAPGLRLFVRVPQGIIILDGRSGIIRAVPIPRLTGWYLRTYGAYAPATDRLFVAGQPTPSASPEIVVVDVGAGSLEKTLMLPLATLTGISVDRNGSRLFVGGGALFTAPQAPGLYVFEPASGAQLAYHPIVPSQTTLRTSSFEIDESRRRVLVITSDPSFTPGAFYGDRISAFNLDTLAHLGTIESRTPLWKDSSPTPFQAHTGPRSPLYIFSADMVSRDRCGRADLEARDPDSGALQRRVAVLDSWGAASGGFVCTSYLTLLSPPPAPTVQQPVVNGGRVTLSWAPSYDALHYDIEAGSAPGVNDLVVSPGHTSTSFTIDGISSGRYFVRVRAINWVGRSLPSNEVEVIVP